MSSDKVPVTQAVRALKEQGVHFVLRPYKYEEKGGAAAAARELHVPEHQVIKTLVMEDEAGSPFLILMHGDRQVSTKALARALGVKSVSTCDPQKTGRHTGYMVGGISPFGTRKPLRVYIEASILPLPVIYINAGKRGLLAEMSPGDLARILKPTPVNVSV